MNKLLSANKTLDNYKIVDIVKYLAAIMVIYVHCNQGVPSEGLNYFFKQIVCRIAVPFFFISSAYFVRRGQAKNPDYLKNYLKGSIKSYLLWSFVFIPIGLNWLQQNFAIPRMLLPFALLFGLFHVGVYYHLWYIPAMILSLFSIDKLLKHFSYKIIFLIAIPLYLFGSLETYYGLLPNGWLKDFFDLIINIFFTTRSGLLFGMIFIAIGFFIYDYQEKLKAFVKYIPLLTILFASLLIAEGMLLYQVPKLDMNFLIMLVPFSFCFFLWVLAFPKIPHFETKKIRELSKYYYFVHTVCIVIVEEITKTLHFDLLITKVINFLIILLLTHLLSLLFIKIQARKTSGLSAVAAVILGAFITAIFSGLFYHLKPADIIIRFEWVHCLWFFISFNIYFLLILKQRKTPVFSFAIKKLLA
ncbi:hypothetical protein M2139_002596 [Enterococcus sp. PF1-24]|uniref:acyltransferase family protein n=1 Tax=unclassified Enterococcus TaxID=2608891 RepID=UPI002474F251|nr:MULTISPECIES: acyltransferase [unclassified Enterococcus]MDH6365593.1 hypothetical protein [Enterococcus sp. PFB1-1]MDH6402691.1 hypothetical protein [Enterococcus sp. PF1-24]